VEPAAIPSVTNNNVQSSSPGSDYMKPEEEDEAGYTIT
jgi:hypothetical protein